MTGKKKSEMKTLLESFKSIGDEVSDMLSSVTHLFLDSLRQVNDFDQRVRAFSFFAINFEKLLLEAHSGFVGGVYWQFNVDSMAEQCNLLDEEHSIVISKYKEDGREGSVVRFVDRAYEPDKVMNSMIVELRKANGKGSGKIDFPTEMPES